MDVIERAKRYAANCPDSIGGQNGHDQLYRVAVALLHGFALSEGDAWPILLEYNQSKCHPRWEEKHIRHKVLDALSKPHDKPRGHLLGSAPTNGAWTRGGDVGRTPWAKSNGSGSARPAPAAGKPKPIAERFNLPEQPIADGAREFIKACFEPSEGIRIVPATLNEDGKEVPDGHGPCLSREEWLRRLDERDGDPNGIWSNDEGTGIYVGINPHKLGGSRDDDVLHYRHVLLEWDQGLSIEEQYNLLLGSNLPLSAVTYSGGSSVHGLVRVDAKDREEYAQRVEFLQEYFAAYGVDKKNKNPSRLSRLPHCRRFDKRQELWALKCGAASFLEWLADKEIEGLGTQVDLGKLLAFDKDNDPSCLIGSRWLCKGGSLLIVGQSGLGKSSLMMQLAILWGLGRAAFGVCPVRPLKSLIIQHENDEGDLAEMFQGVIEGMGLHADSEVALKLKENLIIVRNRTHCGAAFVDVLGRLIERHRPDLCWGDPLYAYIGGDISKAEVCSEFLIAGLGPITEASGVAWMWMHHTTKPPTDSKSRSKWTLDDWSYGGLGSSTLTNWTRASMMLLQKSEGLYELQFGKRGKRAGATDPMGGKTRRVYLQHAERGICWVQVPEPEDAKKKKKADAVADDCEPKKPGRPEADFDLEGFIDKILHEHLTKPQLYERAHKFAKVSRSRFYDRIFPELEPRLTYNETFDTYTVK
jgi:RecA-family ATPase